MECQKKCKKGIVSGQLSQLGPCKGEPGGVRLLGLLTEKEEAYLGSIFLKPEDIKS